MLSLLIPCSYLSKDTLCASRVPVAIGFLAICTHKFVCVCVHACTCARMCACAYVCMYVMHVEMNTLNMRVQKQKENSSFLKLTFTKEGIKVALTNLTMYREKKKGRQQYT